jgi:TonB family protein
VRNVAPKYSPEARAAGIQGTVVLESTVDEVGDTTNTVVLSPLGFGLDEAAREAVRRWKFKPGTKDGKPVRVLACIEVNFILQERPLNKKNERHRTDYNVALSGFMRSEGLAKTDAAETMRRLAREGFAPAMFALVTWIEDGRLAPEGTENVAELLTKAAEQEFPLAMYEVGRRILGGQGFPVDREKGLKLIREAASRGNRQAQLSLANLYETGDVVPKDPELALKYFRLCASGEPGCQYAVARLLLSTPSRKDRDVVEAVARLELAADKAYAPARTLLDQERPNVTALQAKRVAGLKKSLSPPK